MGDNHGLDYSELNRSAQHAISGLGIRKGRLRKGSPEAKAHMARIRAMRGGSMKSFGRTMKKIGKTAFRGVVDATAATLGTAIGGPLGGIGATAIADHTIGNKINGLGIRKRSGKINGGSFLPY